MSPRRIQDATLKAMFQLNSWVPQASDSSKLALQECQQYHHIGLGKFAKAAAATGVVATTQRNRFPQPCGAAGIEPLEPRLLPKLRLQFADFPWSHLPMDQRLFTSES